MRKFREDAITKCQTASRFGIILGTLGHQGSPKVMDHLLVRMLYVFGELFQVSCMPLSINITVLNVGTNDANLETMCISIAFGSASRQTRVIWRQGRCLDTNSVPQIIYRLGCNV